MRFAIGVLSVSITVLKKFPTSAGVVMFESKGKSAAALIGALSLSAATLPGCEAEDRPYDPEAQVEYALKNSDQTWTNHGEGIVEFKRVIANPASGMRSPMQLVVFPENLVQFLEKNPDCEVKAMYGADSHSSSGHAVVSVTPKDCADGPDQG